MLLDGPLELEVGWLLGAGLELDGAVLELGCALLELGAWLDELVGALLELTGVLEEVTLEETLLEETVDELLAFEDWLEEAALEICSTLLEAAIELSSLLEAATELATDDGSSLELVLTLETVVLHDTSAIATKIDTVEKAFNFFIGTIINLLI